MRTLRDQAAGLYVHVPFCRVKCLYCDFYSITSPSLVQDWLDALEQEALLYKDRFPCFDTLYLGGGTPTVLTDEEISLLVRMLRRYFPLSRNAEITLEANPDDLTKERLQRYRDLGFNRISLGVQSMDDRELAFLGRRHTARRAARAMEMIRASEIPWFGIDLIYGLPDQTETAWIRTLQDSLAFSPDHVSCYQLTLSKGTPLWESRGQGLFELPKEEQESRLFLASSEHLEAHGFVHYEVSNYAGGGDPPRVCRHNLKYWERLPYLGLGPSAHSFEGNERWWNHRSVSRYFRDLAQGRTPLEGQEFLSREQIALERLSLQLRTRAGTPLKELAGYANAEEVLSGLLEAGYMEVIGQRAVPTGEGFLVADRLPLLFG